MKSILDIAEITRDSEYDELDQQCRKVEREKKRMVDRMRTLFYKYEKEMDILEAENEDLKLELSIADCISRYKHDEKSGDELNKLVLFYNHLQRKVKNERQKQMELDCKIYSYNEQINELLKSGTPEYYGHLEFFDKIKEITENKIHLINEKLGSLFGSISKIREEVDGLYIERDQFLKNWKKLQTDLKEISLKKKNAISRSLKAYDEREKLRKIARVVLDKNAKDKDSFDWEVKERRRMNNYIGRLNTFMKIKSKCPYRKSALSTKSKNLFLSKLRKIGEDPALNYERQLNQIDIFEGAFNKLCQISGVKDISQIIAKFQTNEAEVHRSVEYINTTSLNRSQLKQEIGKFEEQKFRTVECIKINDDKFHQQILELDEEYSQANSEKLALSKSVSSTKRIVELAFTAIKQLSLMVRCKINAEEDMDSLVPFSVDRVMTAIEDRIEYLHSIYKSHVGVKPRKYKLSDKVQTEEAIAKHPNSLSDSAISEGGIITRSTEDLPSVGETFDDISVNSGNKSQPINDTYLRKIMI